MNFTIQTIGTIRVTEDDMYLEVLPEYKKAMTGLDGFSHLQVIWWFDGCDNKEARQKLVEKQPYVGAPEELGTFATRSPERPNPIAISTAMVTYLDKENGRIGLAYIDARDGSPLLDIKPYTPSLDRIKNVSVPDWCSSWPKYYEDSENFDWSQVFLF